MKSKIYFNIQSNNCSECHCFDHNWRECAIFSKYVLWDITADCYLRLPECIKKFGELK